jgi:hypothetical protein
MFKTNFELLYDNVLIHFLLRSRLFVAFIAAALCVETMFHFCNPKLDFGFIGFIFFATLFSYNTYYLKTKLFQYNKQLIALSIVGGLICFFFCKNLIQFSWLCACVLLASVYLTPVFIVYQKPKAYSFIKLFIVVFVWLVTTTLLFKLPFEIEYNMPFLIFIANRGAIILSVCTLFFIKDESNPSYKKTSKMVLVFAIAIQLFTAFTLMRQLQYPLGLASFIMAGVVYLFAKKIIHANPKSNDWYLLYVDGLLLLQVLLSTIFILLN